MKFLLVDDDPFILKMLSATVEKYFLDASIKVAYNGEEALKVISQEGFIPDIVLMDFMMPGLDGLETSRQIKEWATEKDVFIYILMITAMVERETEFTALKIVDDYVKKPIDIDILISRINSAFRIIKLVKEKTSLIDKNAQLYDHLLEINKMNEKLVNRLYEVIEQMAVSLSEAIEYKDMTTGFHVLRVGYISEAIAIELGLDQDSVEMIKYAGFFHDIGKIGIPDQILQKPGKLTDTEFLEIKKHSEIGAEIMQPINFFKGIVSGIRHHHERWDGKGYPEGQSEESIPLIARIISVADVYDVVLSPRPYKPASTMEEALSEIVKNRGTQFDPKITDIFKKLFDEKKIQYIYNEIDKRMQDPNHLTRFQL